MEPMVRRVGNLEAIVDSTHHEDMLNMTYAAITPNSKLILREASSFLVAFTSRMLAHPTGNPR
jgi:hypothetical protein